MQVTLRAPVEADAARHAAYPPSAEFIRLYGGNTADVPAASLERSERWLRELSAQPMARIIEAGGEAVGHLRLHSLSAADRKARLAIGLFGEELVGRGIGRQAILLALDEAFGEIGLHRVDLRVLAFNERAIRCYRACGFVHEGTEREAAFLDGEWHDDWIMGVLAREHEARRAGR
ncbi:GNAT family N-acetyltransferase [Cereibacter sphaeroides]|nr:GNAT family N-acetyltransferase [Cereibacter sphaeroides]